MSEQPLVLSLLGAELDRAFERAERAERIATVPVARPRRTRRLAFAGAFAAAVIAAALLITSLDLRIGSRVGVDEALADVARKLSVAPQPAPNQYQYTSVDETGTNWQPAGLDAMARPHEGFHWTQKRNSQSWISLQREGRLKWTALEPAFPTETDEKIGRAYFDAIDESNRLQLTAAGRRKMHVVSEKLMKWSQENGGVAQGFANPEIGVSYGTNQASGEYLFAGETLTSEQLAEYPRDPKLFQARAAAQAAKDAASSPNEAGVRGSQNDFGWSHIIQATSGDYQAPIPAELRAAAIEALAFVPGVVYDGEAKDAYGRTGSKFHLDTDGIRSSVIFSKDDAVLLSSTATIIDPVRFAQSGPGANELPTGFELYGKQVVEQKTYDELPPESRIRRPQQ